MPKLLSIEVTIHPEDTHQRLNGTGLIVANPPWRLEETLEEVLPALHRAMGATDGGVRIDWLVPEDAKDA